MYTQWSALDAALCLELACKKPFTQPDEQKLHIETTIRNLAGQKFRAEDSALPRDLLFLTRLPDVVEKVGKITDYFHKSISKKSA